MATHCSMGRCKLSCLPCQLWKHKPALINATTTFVLPLQKHSLGLEKPALLQHYFHQMDTGTTEHSLSTWNMNFANISLRCLSILSFHPPAEMATSFLWLLIKGKFTSQLFSVLTSLPCNPKYNYARLKHGREQEKCGKDSEQGCQSGVCVPLAAVQNSPHTISINTVVSSGVSQHKLQQMLDAIISSFLLICCSSVIFCLFFFSLATCPPTNQKCSKQHSQLLFLLVCLPLPKINGTGTEKRLRSNSLSSYF